MMQDLHTRRNARFTYNSADCEKLQVKTGNQARKKEPLFLSEDINSWGSSACILRLHLK